MGNLTQCCEDESRPRQGRPKSQKAAESMTPVRETVRMTHEDFESIQYLGEGKFGKVVHVKKKDSGQHFAMKLINKKKLSESGVVENTLLEKEILKSFLHPFLVRLNYSFQSANHLYLVMEFVEGGDLYYYLKKERFFPQDTCKVVLAEVLQAISFLHANNVMYRDLKP